MRENIPFNVEISLTDIVSWNRRDTYTCDSNNTTWMKNTVDRRKLKKLIIVSV